MEEKQGREWSEGGGSIGNDREGMEDSSVGHGRDIGFPSEWHESLWRPVGTRETFPLALY